MQRHNVIWSTHSSHRCKAITLSFSLWSCDLGANVLNWTIGILYAISARRVLTPHPFDWRTDLRVKIDSILIIELVTINVICRASQPHTFLVPPMPRKPPTVTVGLLLAIDPSFRYWVSAASKLRTASLWYLISSGSRPTWRAICTDVAGYGTLSDAKRDLRPSSDRIDLGTRWTITVRA
jgi:hypothetical protein